MWPSPHSPTWTVRPSNFVVLLSLGLHRMDPPLCNVTYTHAHQKWSRLWPHCYLGTCHLEWDEVPGILMHHLHHWWAALYYWRSLHAWCTRIGKSRNDASWARKTPSTCSLSFIPLKTATGRQSVDHWVQQKLWRPPWHLLLQCVPSLRHRYLAHSWLGQRRSKSPLLCQPDLAQSRSNMIRFATTDSTIAAALSLSEPYHL